MKKLLLILTLFSQINFSLAQNFISHTIQHDGQTRDYQIYIPNIYDGVSAVPLMFSFHGGGGTIAGNIAINDLRPLANTENFIAVYPQALTDPQNGDATWMHKAPTTHDDIYFISAIIDTLSTQYNIDLSRVYASGYSNGGEFAYDLACRLNTEIAAIGAVARTMYIETFNNCSPTHPTGILSILGTSDNVSNYNGVTFGGVQYYLSAANQHDYWATQNNCVAIPNTMLLPDLNTGDGSTVERNTWSTSSGCPYVEELKVIGGGHDWPGSFGNMDINATQEVWSFVSKYDINGIISCVPTNVFNENQLVNNIFKVFPNPSKDIITINANNVNSKTYKIYSIDGKVRFAGSLNSAVNQINLSTIPSGLYFINIGEITQKLIKN